MKKIRKNIVRERTWKGKVTKITHEFSTWDCIYDVGNVPPNLAKCFTFLRKAMKEDFIERENSPSGMPTLHLEIKKYDTPGLEVQLAKEAEYHGKNRHQHLTVQNYFMAKHPDCLAVEAPVDNGLNRSGLMDFLFYIPKEDGFFIWDFKPNAARERKAATQIYYYREDFAKITGIPINKIRAGWFDDSHQFEIIL
jgi:hypothetical protein